MSVQAVRLLLFLGLIWVDGFLLGLGIGWLAAMSGTSHPWNREVAPAPVVSRRHPVPNGGTQAAEEERFSSLTPHERETIWAAVAFLTVATVAILVALWAIGFHP